MEIGDEMVEKAAVDELDVALLQALTDHPRAGALELARLTGVARATVTARVETAGTIRHRHRLRP